jgi:hypothetical protein
MGDDLSVKLHKQMQIWLRGDADPGNRVFIVAGCPGIGKTWFLKWVAHSGRDLDSVLARILCNVLVFLKARRVIYQTLYVDLDRRHDTDCFRTASAFANCYEEKLNEALQRDVPLCVCFDNVPYRETSGLQIIKDKLVLPALDQNAFLIFIQQDIRGNGFGGSIPTVMPGHLSYFLDDAIARMLQQVDGKQISASQLQTLVHYAKGHPYLALLMYRSSVSEGIEAYLNYWIRKRDLDAQHDRILRYAYPLSLTSPTNAFQMKRLLEASGCASGELNEARDLLGPNALGWWELFSRSPQRYDVHPRWVPVIHASVRYQFKQQNPVLYQQLSEMTKEA